MKIFFFDLWSKKMELMKQNHLLKIGFVIFLKGAPFSDFSDYRLLNYMPSGIQICIPLFWGKFFQLGSSLIKLWASNSFFIVWMDISRTTIYANIPNIFIQKQLLTILISLFLPTIPLVQDSFVLLHVFQDGYCAKFHQAIKKKKVWHLWRRSITIVQLCLNVSPLRWPAGSHAQ